MCYMYIYIQFGPLRWRRGLERSSASGRFSVRIRAVTDLSRKTGSDSSTTVRSAIGVSASESSEMTVINGCPMSQ